LRQYAKHKITPAAYTKSRRKQKNSGGIYPPSKIKKRGIKMKEMIEMIEMIEKLTAENQKLTAELITEVNRIEEELCKILPHGVVLSRGYAVDNYFDKKTLLQSSSVCRDYPDRMDGDPVYDGTPEVVFQFVEDINTGLIPELLTESFDSYREKSRVLKQKLYSLRTLRT